MINYRLTKNSYLATVLLFLLIGLQACVGDQKPEKKVTKYYDLKSLLNEQAGRMGSHKYTLVKEGLLNGHQESSETKPDSLQWTKELKSFYALDLNKVVYEDAYEILEEEVKQGRKVSYRAKNPEKVQVEKMDLWFDDQQQLYKLQAVYRDENRLYTVRKELKARFAPDNEQLESFSEKGLQKLIMGDSLNYQLDAKVMR